MRKYIVGVLVGLFLPALAYPASMKLVWTDTSTREDGFKIERSLAATGPFSEIVSVGPNVQLYIDPNLAEGIQYFYRMRSFNEGGSSTYTPIISATTLVLPPSVPTGFSATPQ